MEVLKKKKISELFKFLPKSKFKAGEGMENGQYPFYTCSNELTKYYNEYTFEPNKLIFGTGGNASLHYASEPFATSTDCYVIEAKELDIDVKYVYYYLKNNFQILEDGFKGAGLKHISKDYLSNIIIEYPDIEDQQRIVKILDKAEEIRTKKKLANEKLDEFLKSTFINMFGDTINNPLQWDIKYFKEFISFITSGSRGWAKYYSNSGELFIRIGNVKNASLSMDDTQFVIAPKNKEAERTKVKENDLLISITADLGRTAVVDKKIANAGAYINQHLCLVRLNKLNPIYAAHYIQHEYCQRQIKCLDQVGVKSGLNFDAIRNLKIINPPIELQNQFAQIVQKVEAQKEKNQKVIEQMDNLFNSLMQQTFKEAV